jgi:folylpolyglutamate synthase/dihydropteroate synthase
MPNVPSAAAERGFEIFLTTTSPTLDAVNERLARQGLPAVSKRMMHHYRQMSMHGVQKYMPINEFDMARKHHMV